ncbi:viroplasmin family protein [Xylocopilactobacillus apicola]|uniref:Ribonuclease H n=1 Tax=Xylocopilactobacillus apicola TaxID=2932184 RepID=A0AAU9DBY7_9LACO|nr:viroplasmin family protein [Xylocopilactobacillus apicola]BDR59065.1 hypothetical protein XA3_15060 [Xylocopilactobacillus apicola]
MKKFYAVYQGRRPGIYDNWPDAEKQVKGFSNGDYRGFNDLISAKEYLKKCHASPVISVEDALDLMDLTKEQTFDEVFAFTNGGYDRTNNVCAWGAILLTRKLNGKLEQNNFSHVIDQAQIQVSSLAGEIQAAISAIGWAVKQNYKSITIFYSYPGLGNWATGVWRPLKAESKKYVEFLSLQPTDFKINFRKLPARSRFKYRVQVKQLAQAALVNQSARTNSDGSVYFNYVGEGWLKEIISYLTELQSPMNLKVEEVKLKNSTLKRTLTFADQRIVITSYLKGSIYVQGDPAQFLMSLVVSIIVSHIQSTSEIVEVLNDYYANMTTQQEVDNEFKAVFPHVNSKNMTDEVLATIKNIAYNLNFKGVKPDYSDLLFPLFRIADYLLNQQVRKYYPTAVQKKRYVNYGQIFNIGAKGKSVTIKKKFLDQINWNKEQKALYCEIYRDYYYLRNQLFHFPSNPEIVLFYDSIYEVKRILRAGALVIDRYYELF